MSLRWFRGSRSLGKISIPPKPARFLLIDQLDGTLWALKANVTEDGIDLVESNEPPKAPGVGSVLDFRIVSDSGFEIYAYGGALVSRYVNDETIRYDGWILLETRLLDAPALDNMRRNLAYVRQLIQGSQ